MKSTTGNCYSKAPTDEADFVPLSCCVQVVCHADPHIGLLHRATEKLIEYKTYLQVYYMKKM